MQWFIKNIELENIHEFYSYLLLVFGSTYDYSIHAELRKVEVFCLYTFRISKHFILRSVVRRNTLSVVVCIVSETGLLFVDDLEATIVVASAVVVVVVVVVILLRTRTSLTAFSSGNGRFDDVQVLEKSSVSKYLTKAPPYWWVLIHSAWNRCFDKITNNKFKQNHDKQSYCRQNNYI